MKVNKKQEEEEEPVQLFLPHLSTRLVCYFGAFRDKGIYALLVYLLRYK